MSWKEELVTALNKLRDKPLGSEMIGIGITGDQIDFGLLLPHIERVNSHSIAWVGPGFLKLAGMTLEGNSAWIVFELSPERKFNEIRVEDVVTGHVGIGEFPMFASVDFLSL